MNTDAEKGSFTIKTNKISRRGYYKLLFMLTYKRPVMKIFLVVAFLLLAWILLYSTNMTTLPRPIIYQYLAVLTIIVVQPLAIFWTIKRNYDSSNHLRERLEVEFNHHGIKIRGESFYLEVLWEKLFKIEEEKNWILIYQNTLSAIIIPRKAFTADQLRELKAIIGRIPQLPVRLLKES